MGNFWDPATVGFCAALEVCFVPRTTSEVKTENRYQGRIFTYRHFFAVREGFLAFLQSENGIPSELSLLAGSASFRIEVSRVHPLSWAAFKVRVCLEGVICSSAVVQYFWNHDSTSGY